MSKIFIPETPFEHAVHAGDHAGVLELLRALPRDERILHRASARRMKKLIDEARWNSRDETYCGWGTPPQDAHADAMFAMVVVCGTAQDVASTYAGSRNWLLPLCEEFTPDCLQELAAAKLADNPRTIGTVQDLIVAGLIERPESDDYIIGLISLGESRSLQSVCDADPGLRDVLLRVMDVEGTREHSLASVDKYRGGTASWSYALRRLRDEGSIRRKPCWIARWMRCRVTGRSSVPVGFPASMVNLRRIFPC